jgi:hypothetical protein
LGYTHSFARNDALSLSAINNHGKGGGPSVGNMASIGSNVNESSNGSASKFVSMKGKRVDTNFARSAKRLPATQSSMSLKTGGPNVHHNRTVRNHRSDLSASYSSYRSLPVETASPVALDTFIA